MMREDPGLVMLVQNPETGIWRLSVGGDRPKLVELDGFVSLDNHEDAEKVNLILGSWGLASSDPGIWRSRDGGGWVLITSVGR